MHETKTVGLDAIPPCTYIHIHFPEIAAFVPKLAQMQSDANNPKHTPSIVQSNAETVLWFLFVCVENA